MQGKYFILAICALVSNAYIVKDTLQRDNEEICEGIDGTGPGCDHQGNETVCLGLGCCLVDGGCFLSNSDPVGPPGYTCDVSLKVDCGVLGTNRDSCVASGCCWYTSTVSGEPWCFEGEPGGSNVTTTTTTAAPGTTKPSNGTATVDPDADLYCEKEDSEKRTCEALFEQDCLDMGCCWETIDPTLGPSCFYGLEYDGPVGACAVDASNKEPCGDQNDRDICLNEGCCWSPTMSVEQPDCFTASGAFTTETVPEGLYCDKDNAQKRDCGDEIIAEVECEALNCCWEPISPTEGPSCYYGLEYDGPLDECIVNAEDKLECADPNNRTACLEAGCCWSPTANVEESDCFSPTGSDVTDNPTPGTTTTPGAGGDICEGIDGTGPGCDHQGNETVCLGLGCCLVDGGCFLSNSDPVGPDGVSCSVGVKVDCGVLGTNRDSCVASGCCWYTSTVSGEPWCYEGETVPRRHVDKSALRMYP